MTFCTYVQRNTKPKVAGHYGKCGHYSFLLPGLSIAKENCNSKTCFNAFHIIA